MRVERLILMSLNMMLLTLYTMVASLPAHSLASSGVACIDDSDCVSLGYKYACFMYFCHNWVDESQNHPHCEVDWQCPQKSRCYRHWNLREVDHGVCFSEYQMNVCSAHNECAEDDFCCGMYCCSEQYYRQWQNFTCLSDVQCRSWRTGEFCCPDNHCCDEKTTNEDEVELEPPVLSDYEADVKVEDSVVNEILSETVSSGEPEEAPTDYEADLGTPEEPAPMPDGLVGSDADTVNQANSELPSESGIAAGDNPPLPADDLEPETGVAEGHPSLGQEQQLDDELSEGQPAPVEVDQGDLAAHHHHETDGSGTVGGEVVEEDLVITEAETFDVKIVNNSGYDIPTSSLEETNSVVIEYKVDKDDDATVVQLLPDYNQTAVENTEHHEDGQQEDNGLSAGSQPVEEERSDGHLVAVSSDANNDDDEVAAFEDGQEVTSEEHGDPAVDDHVDGDAENQVDGDLGHHDFETQYDPDANSLGAIDIIEPDGNASTDSEQEGDSAASESNVEGLPIHKQQDSEESSDEELSSKNAPVDIDLEVGGNEMDEPDDNDSDEEDSVMAGIESNDIPLEISDLSNGGDLETLEPSVSIEEASVPGQHQQPGQGDDSLLRDEEPTITAHLPPSQSEGYGHDMNHHGSNIQIVVADSDLISSAETQPDNESSGTHGPSDTAQLDTSNVYSLVEAGSNAAAGRRLLVRLVDMLVERSRSGSWAHLHLESRQGDGQITANFSTQVVTNSSLSRNRSTATNGHKEHHTVNHGPGNEMIDRGRNGDTTSFSWEVEGISAGGLVSGSLRLMSWTSILSLKLTVTLWSLSLAAISAWI